VKKHLTILKLMNVPYLYRLALDGPIGIILVLENLKK
jgi:hypothetical protein